jgi:hypothetical protein
MGIMAATRLEEPMTQQDIEGELAGRDDAPSAISVLYRILANAIEVDEVERIGCTELPEGGGMSYGMSVALADGQHLLVDVQEQ